MAAAVNTLLSAANFAVCGLWGLIMSAADERVDDEQDLAIPLDDSSLIRYGPPSIGPPAHPLMRASYRPELLDADHLKTKVSAKERPSKTRPVRRSLPAPTTEYWLDIFGTLLGHQQVTDAYLLRLAGAHNARFVTFDRRLPSVAVRPG
jgi:hypothetical protein